jgi:glutamine amidotransferase
MKLGLIDYGRGNLRSVEKALERAGASVVRIGDPKLWPSDLDGLVLPGVGAFGDAMTNLRQRKLDGPVRSWLDAGRPFLGICLGYQLLFEESDENPGVKGLGFLPGRIVRFPDSVGKIPHMGWNRVSFREGPYRSLDGGSFYHVHSYYPEQVPDGWTACTTDYNGVEFCSGVARGPVSAFQFHPEKSQENGRRLLALFTGQIG